MPPPVVFSPGRFRAAGNSLKLKRLRERTTTCCDDFAGFILLAFVVLSRKIWLKVVRIQWITGCGQHVKNLTFEGQIFDLPNHSTLSLNDPITLGGPPGLSLLLGG